MSVKDAYRSDIDGLRAIAVSVVLIFHAFPTLLPGGFVGVDIFFVISGFLITNIILKQIQTGTFSIAHFYSRRIRRIFPALFTMLAAVFVWGCLTLYPDELHMLSKHIWGGSFFIANIQFLTEAGYFDQASNQKLLLHLWSLGIEEQFYFFWPILLMFFFQWRKAFVPLLILASFISYLAVAPQHPDFAFFMLPTRFWEMAIGGGLAVFWTDVQFFRQRYSRALFLIGMLLITYGVFSIHEAGFLGILAAIPAIGASLVLLANDSGFLSRAILSNRVSVYIGEISYPLYLWHWPLLTFARIYNGGTITPSLAAGLLFLSVILSALTYSFIEKPIRFGILSKKSPAWIAVVVFVIGAVALVNDRTDFLFSKTQKEIKSSFEDNYAWQDQSCPAPDKKLDFCKKTAGVEKSKFVLIGDSHAAHLYSGLSQTLADDGLTILANSSCPTVLGITIENERKDGELRSKEALEILFNLYPADTDVNVILSNSFSYMMDSNVAADHLGKRAGPLYTSINGKTDRASKKELFQKGLTDFVAKLIGAKKSVTIVKDIPELPFFPKNCVRGLMPLRDRLSSKDDCRVPSTTVKERQRDYDDVLAAVQAKFPSIRLIDPKEFMCDPESCYVIRDDLVLYRDSHHLSIKGSRWLAEKIKSQLRPALPSHQ